MKVVLLMRATSPITHGAGTAGNEQIIARYPVNTPYGVKQVPVLSGNSLRHRLLREPHADAILGEERISKEQLRWLFNGGELSGKCPNVDTARIAEFQSLLPHIDLLGCSMPDTIVAGKLECGIAWLACMESQSAIEAELPEELREPGNVFSPAHELVRSYQYYRHDASKNREALPGEDLAYKGMPHGGEHVVAGAAFVCVMHTHGLSELSQSALLWGIETWSEHGATVGGQSSRGHGRVEPIVWTDSPVDSSLYAAHLAANRDKMLQAVRRLYAKGAA